MRRTTALVLAVPCLAALGGCGPAEQTSSSGTSPESQISPIPDIAYEEFRLANGLRVVVHEDHKAPIAAVTVWYHVGSKNEVAGKTGFAHLFEHLMFNGSEHYNDEYFKPFQQVGATSQNGTTDFDRTNYFETVPSTALDLALWMESDRMGHLLGAIDQGKLDEQRGVVQNEKRQGENQPYGRVFEHLMANIFPPGHPYSWLTIGSMADLNAASLDDVRQWFKAYYGPNNATLVIAGDVDTASVKDKVEHYFGDIPPGPPITRQTRWVPARAANHREVLEDRVPQARIYKAWPAPEWRSPESNTLQLVDGVLSGGKTSRLYRRLVYDDQVASDVGSFYLDGEIAGVFVIYATAQPGHDLGELEQRIDEELEHLRSESPSEQEVGRVKTDTIASFVRGIEQVGGFNGKSNILAENAVYGGSPDYYKQAFSEFLAQTPDDVRAATQKWLAGDSFTLEVHPYDGDLKATGTGADRSGPPMPTSFPRAPFPETRETTLPNGMRIIVAERHAVPVVRFSLQLDAGYAADEFAKPGTANLAMQMLDEGAGTADALQISESLAQLGADLATGSNLDTSFVSLSALKSRLDESLAIYADVILDPTFPPAELERLRKLELSDIQQEKTSPMTMALRVLPELLYGRGHAYALPMTGSGTEESVMAMSREDLTRFHDTWFKPNKATMIVVGDTTLDEIEPKLRSLFADWQPGDTPAKDIANVEAPTAERVFLIDRPGSQQSIVIAGQLMPQKSDERDVAIDAMNDILGGSFTSRINMNLREDKTWSYGTRSLIIDARGQQPFIAYAPVQADKTGPAMAEMAREMKEFVTTRGPTAEEVSLSKKRSTLTLPGRWETARAVAGDIAQLVRFGLPQDYWTKYPELVDGLSTAAVESAARETLTPDRMTWVIVGDRSQVESQLSALAIGPVTIIDTEGRALPQN